MRIHALLTIITFYAAFATPITKANPAATESVTAAVETAVDLAADPAINPAVAPVIATVGMPGGKEFTIGVSIYTGWMPYYWMKETGTLDAWAKAHGIEVEIRDFSGQYVASIEGYMSDLDAVVATNMDTLVMPAMGGTDNTVLLVGDFSNGNDAILTRNGITVPQLKGKRVYLEEFSVSHYLLARALQLHGEGLTLEDVQIVNTPFDEIQGMFLVTEDMEVVVTWNPAVMDLQQKPGVTSVFDSSATPGEILDCTIVKTKVLQQNPVLGDVLAGAWFETLGIMSRRGQEADAAMTIMAESYPCTLTEYKGQLRSTAMFYTAAEAVEHVESEDLRKAMDTVRKTVFEAGWLEGADSADYIGIQYPDGTVVGSSENIKIRFDTTYMVKARDGKLTRS